MDRLEQSFANQKRMRGPASYSGSRGLVLLVLTDAELDWLF